MKGPQLIVSRLFADNYFIVPIWSISLTVCSALLSPRPSVVLLLRRWQRATNNAFQFAPAAATVALHLSDYFTYCFHSTPATVIANSH